MQTQVLVVGAGPVGLTMAAELARFGVAVRIVDTAARATQTSKALVLWSRTLELIERMGCVQTFVDAGNRVGSVNIVAGGQRVAHVDFDQVATPYPYALMLAQSETERLMDAHLRRLGVTVEREVELTGFTQGEDGVDARLRRADGTPEAVRVDWLVGCDGAHSSVRHLAGMAFAGETLPSDWILADVHLAGVRSPASELDMYWHADGILALFPITADRYRVIADVGNTEGGTRRPDPALDEVQAILDQRGPGGIVASAPVWLSAFRINERKVAEYRAGRVFLAGDAAHIHSPAGGQGMNTGMQDACNLAWKLALVCHGCAPEPLLGSYSTERSAVGQEVLTNAGRLTAVATLRNRLAQSLRNHAASVLFGLSPVRAFMADTLTELSIGYPHSPLTQAGPHGRHGPRAGQRAPIRADEAPVGAGAAPRFALFAAPGEASARVLGARAHLLEPAARPAFEDGAMWLVRPDGYVATSTAADDADGMLAYLAGLNPR